MRGWLVIPMGAIPRLFMAVAQALGSDIGIPKELESIVILRRPSVEGTRYKDKFYSMSPTSHFLNEHAKMSSKLQPAG